MRAIDGVRRSGVGVRPQRPIRDAAVIMDQAGVGSLAVIDDDRLVGIITDRDPVRRGLAQDLAATAAVEKVMTSPVVTIDADADLHAAFTLFRAHAVRPPAGWADLSQPTTDSDAATTVTDETRYPDPSDPVRLYVSDDLIRIGPDATLHQIAQRLAAEGVGALVVVHGDRVLGVISERDVIRALPAGKDLDSITAADLDARDVVTCTPDTTVRAAAALMMEHYVRHLLVEDRNGPSVWSRPGISSAPTHSWLPAA